MGKAGMAEARRPARAAVPLIVHPASALVFSVGVCLLLWVALAHFRLNVSPSVPLGVYRVHRVPDRLDRGMLVLVSVPDGWKTIAFARGWVHEPWWPDRATLLKPIGGVAGDRVCREDDTLWINGEGYGPVVQESYGTVIPAALAEGECLVVPPGYVFLASRVEKSFDSRYYGCVQVSKVAHLLTPFYVW